MELRHAWHSPKFVCLVRIRVAFGVQAGVSQVYPGSTCSTITLSLNDDRTVQIACQNDMSIAESDTSALGLL